MAMTKNSLPRGVTIEDYRTARDILKRKGRYREVAEAWGMEVATARSRCVRMGPRTKNGPGAPKGNTNWRGRN